MTIQKNKINSSKTLTVDENILSGIVLSDRHAKLVWKRNKKEIVKADNVNSIIGKPIYLCGKKVYGIIVLNEPHRMDLQQFKSSSHSERHKITNKELYKLWPDVEKFYGYSFRIKKMFKKPLKYKYVDSKDFIDEVEFINKPKKTKVKKETIKEQVVREEPKVEEKEIIYSNSRLDKYYNKLSSLKALEFSGKYKEIAKIFLELYELYLEKRNSKIYDEDGVVLKPAPDVTENYIRIRIRDPKTIVEGTFRTIIISESQGIKAVIGRLRKDPQGPTKVQSVLFKKEQWTTERAMAWVREHKESLKSLDSDELKEKKEDTEKKSERYITDGGISRDKDKGKQKEKWVYCDNCKKVFDYYKQLLDDASTLICPHCGALIIYEET